MPSAVEELLMNTNSVGKQEEKQKQYEADLHAFPFSQLQSDVDFSSV